MFRKTIFWIHLSSGVVAGVVILIMSVTGVLLTFQSQIVDFANRAYSTVRPPHSGAERMDLDAVLSAVRNVETETEPTSVTIRPDPDEAYVVRFGRVKTVFVDPYTGDVRGEGNIAVRDFLREIVYWHRWFAAEGENRAVTRAVTGACNLAFCLLIITGLYIWWPRKWTLAAFKAVFVPNFRIKGKNRDFNWHNSFGIWCLPALFLISLSGLVISYRWAGNLVYTLTGTEPPQRASQAAAEPEYPEEESAPSSFAPSESFLDAARKQVPEWAYITLNLPKEGAETTTLTVSEMDNRIPLTRSTLTVSTSDAESIEWVPFTSLNMGRQIRTWLRWIHTGEAAGWFGQLIAGVASAGAVVLVWTGLSLAWRRFRRYNRSRQDRAYTTKDIPGESDEEPHFARTG
ncbi:MAG: PepSY-associated TM helix domain-containing protein [Gemmatimonadetes bacterium]|nr:PepSY-associated TM helix domain-containing protein [Gemmatimonadota bacterium]